MSGRVITVLRRLFFIGGVQILRDPTSWPLIVGNIAVAIYVLFHPPITSGLLGVYLCECAIIGAFNVLKMFMIPVALGPAAAEHPVAGFVLRTLARLFCSAFFLFHYGYFLLICTAIVGGLEGEEMKINKLSRVGEQDQLRGLLVAVIILTASHAVSFVWNYLVKKEYRNRTMKDQMIRPYGRVFVMFFSLLFGGILASAFHLPILLMLVFVPIKIMADLHAHFRDHNVRAEPFVMDERGS